MDNLRICPSFFIKNLVKSLLKRDLHNHCVTEDFLRTSVGCYGSRMEGREKLGNKGIKHSFTSNNGQKGWAKIVGGQARRLSWTSHNISEMKVEQLKRYFTMILKFLGDEWRKLGSNERGWWCWCGAWADEFW